MEIAGENPQHYYSVRYYTPWTGRWLSTSAEISQDPHITISLWKSEGVLSRMNIGADHIEPVVT
jgi:hypothetical protein